MIGSHLPARVLAAVIDYLIVKSVSAIFLPGSILGFFVVAAVYFTAGGSKALGGCTVGKRFFGLRVEAIGDEKQLSVFRSFIRFFFLYGIIVLIAELPTYIYRTSEVVAPLPILDLHFFFALAYFLSLVALVIFSDENRGIHDFVASSFVSRADEQPSSPGARFWQKRNLGIILLASSLSAVLWTVGAFKAPEAEAVLSRRYKLEKQFELEFAGADLVSIPEKRLYIRCVSHQNLSEPEEMDRLAKLSQYLVEEGIVEKGLILRYLVLNITSQSQTEYIYDGEIKAAK